VWRAPARLRASRYGALGPEPSHGLPTVAHAEVGKRERRLARPAGLEPATPGLEGENRVAQPASSQELTKGAMPECHAASQSIVVRCAHRTRPPLSVELPFGAVTFNGPASSGCAHHRGVFLYTVTRTADHEARTCGGTHNAPRAGLARCPRSCRTTSGCPGRFGSGRSPPPRPTAIGNGVGSAV